MIAGRERVEARRQDRVRLRVRPLPLELLQRDDDLDRLLDRVDAAAGLPACVDGEVSRRGVRLHALDLDAEVHEPALGGAQPQLCRLDRDRDVAGGARSTISRVPLPTTSSSLTTWKMTSPRGSKPLLERHLRRPHRRGEAALHVGRAPAVEAAVDDLAAERILRPGAAVTDRHDVDVGVERERAAAARPGQARDEQRMSVERRRRADVPAFDLEAELGQEVADVARCSAAPRRGSGSPPSPGSRCGRRSGRAAGSADPSCEASTASTTAAPRPSSTTRRRSARPRTRRQVRRGGGCGRPRRTRAHARRRRGA